MFFDIANGHVEQVCAGVGAGVVENMPQSRSCRASARHERHGGKGLTHGLPCEWLVGNAHVYVSFMNTLVCSVGESHRSRFRIGISTSAPMRTRKFPVRKSREGHRGARTLFYHAMAECRAQVGHFQYGHQCMCADWGMEVRPRVAGHDANVA